MDMGVLVIILTIRGFWVQNNATVGFLVEMASLSEDF